MMSTATISADDILAAVAGVFGESLDTQRQQLLAFWDGLREKHDEDKQLDREWAQRMYPRLKLWLGRLSALESNYQKRIATFLVALQEEAPGLMELFDEWARHRVERVWGAVTEFFESVMPEELLVRENAELFIDIESATAWWTGAPDDKGVDLSDVINDCVRTAGEFSEGAVVRLAPRFVRALCEGTAPFPGFRYQRTQDGVAVWLWLSTKAEASAPEDGDISVDLLDPTRKGRASELAAFLAAAATAPLPPTAAAGVHRFVDAIESLGEPYVGLVQEMGTSLGIHVLAALQNRDIDQLRYGVDALSVLAQELAHRQGLDYGKTRTSAPASS